MMHTIDDALQAAGRAFFRDIYGNETSNVAGVFEFLGGKVAMRFHVLRDWDAVELEGFEDAKHLTFSGWNDAAYLYVVLPEIAPNDPKGAYQRIWSEAVDRARDNWPAIVELAQSLLRRA